MNKFEYALLMDGSGVKNVSIPPGLRYVSIINNSDNVIEIYQDRRTLADANIGDTLVKVPYYTQLTIPIREGTEFTFIYTDGGSVGTKKAVVIFSSENLGISGVLGNPSSGGSVTLVADGIGLARQNQLPLALGSTGGLKVEIQGAPNITVSNEVEVKNDAGNPVPVGITGTLPALSAGDNNIGNVDIASALPAGTNNIGDVDIASMPSVDLTGKTAVKVSGTGDQTVKGTAGKVFGIVAVTSGVTVILKDENTERWAVLPQTEARLMVPINCWSSIVLNFSGAGVAYIIYE